MWFVFRSGPEPKHERYFRHAEHRPGNWCSSVWVFTEVPPTLVSSQFTAQQNILGVWNRQSRLWKVAVTSPVDKSQSSNSLQDHVDGWLGHVKDIHPAGPRLQSEFSLVVLNIRPCLIWSRRKSSEGLNPFTMWTCCHKDSLVETRSHKEEEEEEEY